jgi:hypothetical protein
MVTGRAVEFLVGLAERKAGVRIVSKGEIGKALGDPVTAAAVVDAVRAELAGVNIGVAL